MGHEFGDIIETLAVFGGIAMVILASAKAKLDNRKLDMQRGQPVETHAPASEDKVLAEMKAMRQQMEQMQSTSHQFDLSFDAALNRLEERVSRVETKAAARTTTPAAADAPNTLRNGQSQ